jgi:hypothetical protein
MGDSGGDRVEVVEEADAGDVEIGQTSRSDPKEPEFNCYRGGLFLLR